MYTATFAPISVHTDCHNYPNSSVFLHSFKVNPQNSWKSFSLSKHNAQTQNKCKETRHRASTEHSLTFHFHAMLSQQRNPCTDCNLPNSAQLEATPTIPQSYTRVCAVVWECSTGQTHRHTRPIYILRRLRLVRNVITRATSQPTLTLRTVVKLTYIAMLWNISTAK